MKNLINIILMNLLFWFSLSSYSLDHNDDACNQNNKNAVIKLIDEVWNKRNFEIIDQLIAPQYTIRHDPGDKWEHKTIDLVTYQERVKSSFDVFPDQKFHIEDLVCSGNKIAISWILTGTQKGEIPGMPVTNKKVHVSGITIYYFSKDKIIGHWQVIDRLSVFQQLGITKKNPSIKR